MCIRDRGSVVGEKIARIVEHATAHRLPLVFISGSGGGARMDEGALSLMQMAKTSAALAKMDEAGGLYISVLTNPTTGGVMASFAALGDLVVAEPHALIGFAGPRVIQETLRQTLPEGFQRSEFLAYLWKYEDGQVRPEGEWRAPILGPEDDEKEEGEEGADSEEAAESKSK